jgi:glycosyltransferase involved in cell wall biosynthesis
VFDFQNSVFSGGPPAAIPQDAQIVLVSDLFADEYAGGAELTTEGLIETSPFKVHKLKSKDVTLELLRQGTDKFWVFGNFAQLNPQLIPSIVGNLRYTVLEYDFKFCRFRSPDKHMAETKLPCDCDQQMNGKVISAFLYGSMGIWWMSENQKDQVTKRFPFLLDKDNMVLSSVFPSVTLGKLRLLREQRAKLKEEELGPWVVLGSPSWIKGKEAAETYCKENELEYEVVWGLPYDELLAKMSTAKGHVYHPEGGDTCPRMVIEAQLMGVPVVLNDNVLHKDEEWFDTEDLTVTEEYLLAAPGFFWKAVKKMMDYRPQISGYTTTFNCVDQEYPFEQCIRSMLEFCDEVCVVDGGSTDGTQEVLKKLNEEFFISGIAMAIEGFRENSRVKVKIVERDWDHPRFAVFDGAQKAEARAMCTKEFCWQMDSDEIVHEDDVRKITELARNMPKQAGLIALPVIEYWGGADKVRMDVTPWKWRISRNDPDYTHGIPARLRAKDDNGDLYALEGTDGCDLISRETGDPVPFVNFYTPDVDNARRVAMLGNEQAREQYEHWFNQVATSLPCVFHYSWYDLPRKIRLYRDYWTRHWNSLYNKSLEDTAETNMMFDVPWSEVTEEMIEARGTELAESLGGWVWHRKWNGKTKTPHIQVARQQPKVML